jgi:hypothetical protein
MDATLTVDGIEIAVKLLEIVHGEKYGARCLMPSGRVEMHIFANVCIDH